MGEIGQVIGDLLERLSRRLPRGGFVVLIVAALAFTVFLLAWAIALLVR